MFPGHLKLHQNCRNCLCDLYMFQQTMEGPCLAKHLSSLWRCQERFTFAAVRRHTFKSGGAITFALQIRSHVLFVRCMGNCKCIALHIPAKRIRCCLQGDPFEMFNSFFNGGGMGGSGGNIKFTMNGGGMPGGFMGGELPSLASMAADILEAACLYVMPASG